MSFPGLYNQVTHVPTAVLTHEVHLVMYLMLYLRTYCTNCAHCTRTYHTYCCAVRTTYCCTYVLHCQYTYVYIYIVKKRWCSGVSTVGTYTYIMYVRIAPIDIRTACTYCWCTCDFIKSWKTSAVSTTVWMVETQLSTVQAAWYIRHVRWTFILYFI